MAVYQPYSTAGQEEERGKPRSLLLFLSDARSAGEKPLPCGAGVR